MSTTLRTRMFMKVTSWADDRIGWDHLPKPLALLVLIGDRMVLRRTNLADPEHIPVGWGPEPILQHRSLTRTTTGVSNDLVFADMGSAGSVFGRNVPVADTTPRDVLEPNPRIVSERLLARRAFLPVPSLNLLAASWLQFEVHDWLSHGLNEPHDPFDVELAHDDPWTHERPMRVERTKQGPPTTDGQPPTFRNTETHWWDASQLYGSTQKIEDFLRTRTGGKLRLSDDQLLPFNPSRFPLGQDVNLAGVAGNWWVGQAMLHTLFMREHNSICDMLADANPQWTDDQLFDHARLVNAAQIAKIHTIEWTPALLSTSVLDTAMHANWYGLLGKKWKRRLGQTNLGEEISGIPRSKTYHHGAPYAITEEFVAVYRMHPLIPDDYVFRRSADGAVVCETQLNAISGHHVDAVLADISMNDLFYSFGTSHPGQITLRNFPNQLREFVRPDGSIIDLATYDIVRSRERGVPRYNDFRRRFHLRPAETFDEMSDDPAIVADLREIYKTPDDVDTMVGLFAEKLPKGFAFSDTAFRVFALMASRRLKSDRFYSYDYRPEVYTKEGMQWIESSSLVSVLLRHYPDLLPALDGVKNAFRPWNPAANRSGHPVQQLAGHKMEQVAARDEARESGRISLRWRLRRQFWNSFVTFKYHQQRPSVIPVPVDAKPIASVAIAAKYPDIDMPGITVSDRVPRDEAQPLKHAFTRIQGRLDRRFPLTRPGLPQIDANAGTALHNAYTAKHSACYPPPIRPTDLRLGTLATTSPYSSELRSTGGDTYRWDLSSLRAFEVHPGLLPLGAIVEFRLDQATIQLEATRIETVLGTARPGDADWDVATRLAMCSLTNHTALVRHFNWLHLVCGGPLAIATRNQLPASHPVRRLLWPHVFGTQYSNDIVTPLLIGRNGDYENTFSFTHRGLCDLFSATAGTFDLADINPAVDAERRGIDPQGFPTPSQANRVELYDVIAEHVCRYLAIYFPSDAAITADGALGAWANELHEKVPHGLSAFGGPHLTQASAATILATFIHMATVEHEILGSGLWDYQLWSDASPVRMAADGRRMSVGEYQRLVNGDFNLNVRRTLLLDDFSPIALDGRGALAFQRFRRDLLDLQARLDLTPGSPWRMEPKRLKANINA